MHASDELKGDFKVENFNTKDNNVMSNSLANYDIKNIRFDGDVLSLDIKLTDYITTDFKDYVIKDGSYKLNKKKYINVDGHKMNYGTYVCQENGNKLILKEDGTFKKIYSGYNGIPGTSKGTFAVEDYDMSQDNSNDIHECIVIKTSNGSHGGFISKSDYSLKDGEWFVYEFESYEQE